MRKIFTLTLLLLVGIVVNAQLYNPVKFTSELKTNGTADAEIIFTGKIDKGWHVYSTNLGQEGPTEATFNVNRLEGVKLVGKMKAVGHEIAAYDKNFEMNLRFFESNVRFVQKIKFTKPAYSIDVYLKSTRPLMDFYAQRDLLYRVDGVGSIEEIHQRLNTAMDQLQESEAV